MQIKNWEELLSQRTHSYYACIKKVKGDQVKKKKCHDPQLLRTKVSQKRLVKKIKARIPARRILRTELGFSVMSAEMEEVGGWRRL